VDFEQVTHLSPPEGSENGAPTDVNARGKLAPSPRGRRSPRRWRRWLAAVVVLAGLVGSAAYWGTGKDATAQYVTAPVTRGTVAVAVTATGTVNPVTVVMVGTYVSGRVERLYCDYNTPVRAGQLCAKIDPRPFQMVVDQMKATVAVQKAQLAKDRANLAYAKTTLERDRRLQQRGIVAQAIVDNDESLYGQAQAQIDFDESNVQAHQAELHAAEVNLGYTNIIAPVNGTVVSRSVEIGQTVAASFQTPILFLVATDLTKMQVDTSVSESDIGGVKVGDRATFTVQAFPNRPFEGRVRQARQAPVTVQNVVTYDVVVSVDNREGLLKPGMTATTRIIKTQRENVLTVPEQALRFRRHGQGAVKPAHAHGGAAAATVAPRAASAADAASRGRVWVLRAGEPVAVPVSVGLTDGTSAEVLAGALHEGDPVIVSEVTSDADAGAKRSAPSTPFRLFRVGGR
jgi:HlyD family secretion protein